MKLKFDTKLADDYKSSSQKIRVLSEHWVDSQVYCPNCGHLDFDKCKNNKPVSDFFCSNCKEVYELKSKKKSFGSKVLDSAYKTMIESLQGNSNPNFFLLNYDFQNFEVLNFLVIPKHFFIPEIIEKRKPLSLYARRAGWIGCNILLHGIPQTGKIFFVKNKIIEPKERVLLEWKRTLFLREEKKAEAKGWILDIIKCIEALGKKDFYLDEVYRFEAELAKKYPDNKHVKDKIRQQLQILRDRGYLEFLSRGQYRLTS